MKLFPFFWGHASFFLSVCIAIFFNCINKIVLHWYILFSHAKHSHLYFTTKIPSLSCISVRPALNDLSAILWINTKSAEENLKIEKKNLTPTMVSVMKVYIWKISFRHVHILFWGKYGCKVNSLIHTCKKLKSVSIALALTLVNPKFWRSKVNSVRWTNYFVTKIDKIDKFITLKWNVGIAWQVQTKYW